MLGVRLQGRREITVESGRSECALHEIGLRASEVRYSLAPWMQRRTRTVPAEIREGAIGGHTVVGSAPHNRPSMHHQTRKHVAFPARSQFTGRRSVRVGSWHGCGHGGLGGLGLRRTFQVFTDLAEKRSGWQIAR